ncbi:MAG: cytidylate kinase family protein [Anaerosacchariphilus sp.]
MKKVITIAREFGAGGGEIGRRVAKELGIEFYDKDIILRTALANSKLDPELVRKWDERVPKSFGFAQSLFDFYNKPLDESSGRPSGTPSAKWQIMRTV